MRIGAVRLPLPAHLSALESETVVLRVNDRSVLPQSENAFCASLRDAVSSVVIRRADGKEERIVFGPGELK